MKRKRLNHLIVVRSALAVVFLLASSSGTFGKSGHAIAQAPAATERNSETGFSDAGLEGFVTRMEGVFNSGQNSSNPAGRPLRNWTPDDFGVLGTDMLTLIRAVISSERYDLVDRLKPQSMRRAEYSRAILREAARRNNGDLEDIYAYRLDAPVSSVTVSRPIGVAASAQVRVTADPEILAIHDAAANILKNPRYGGVVFEPDVAQAMRRPDLALAGVPVRTDAATYDLGYTAGALVSFRQGQPLALSVSFVQKAPVVQAGYCAVAFDIFRSSGRTVDQTEAFVAGFAQARVDARRGFQGQDAALGIMAHCPPVAVTLSNQDRLNFAIVR